MLWVMVLSLGRYFSPWFCFIHLLMHSRSSLIALFELAAITTFGCSQIVACVSRSQKADEMELVRNLGWCGFSLTTLEPWISGMIQKPALSSRWLFLAAEV